MGIKGKPLEDDSLAIAEEMLAEAVALSDGSAEDEKTIAAVERAVDHRGEAFGDQVLVAAVATSRINLRRVRKGRAA